MKTETCFEITIPQHGKFEIHSTCKILTTLTLGEEKELIQASQDIEINKTFLRTLTSMIAARRRNIDILLNYIETKLSFLTLETESNKAYRAAVGAIFQLLTYLDTMDRAITMAYNGTCVESFLKGKRLYNEFDPDILDIGKPNINFK